MPVDKVPIQTFFEQIEKRLTPRSAEELRSILQRMATTVAPADRRGFLESLKPVKGAREEIQRTLRQDRLLADIEDLDEDIAEAMQNAEEWEDPYDRHDEHWDDEDSLGPYEEFVDALEDLFDRAEGVFDRGDLQLARAAFHKLFEILQREDDYGRGVRPEDLQDTDINEARARYLRAVYETEPLQRRPALLFEEMTRFDQFHWHERVKLADLIQVSVRPFPDREPFLRDWMAFLRKQKGAQADRLLREAVQLAEGPSGLAAFTRKEGKKHPRAYLDWVAALRSEGKQKEVVAAAKEALKKLPRNLPLRAAVADHLCAAAEEVHDQETVRKGRWEAFAAQPVLKRLLDLWDVTPAAKRSQRLGQAERHLASYLQREAKRSSRIRDWDEEEVDGDVRVTSSVLAYAHLLNGSWKAARALAAHQRELGWSSSDNPQGVVVPAFLVLLYGDATLLPANLAKVWAWTLENSTSEFFGEDTANEPERLAAAYGEVVQKTRLDKASAQSLLDWCVDLSKRRAGAIVENQRRKSYDRAALLIGACVEVLKARGQDEQAEALVTGLQERFPRHRAFQDELQKTLAKAQRATR